jgi:hypothetical protein
MLGLLAVVLFSAAVCAAPLKVKVTKIKGNVMVMKAGASNWTAATDNMSLNKGSQVKTAAGGSCILAWENGNVVRVNELSAMAITESMKDGAAQKTGLDVKNGKTYAKVGKLQSSNSEFTIKTPTAIAGVRGSEIIVTADPGVSSFQVLDGSFAVESEGVEVVIDQNFQVDVVANEPPPEPAEIPAEELDVLKTEAEEIKAEAESIELEFGDDEDDGEDDSSLQDDDEDSDEDDGEDTSLDSDEDTDSGDALDTGMEEDLSNEDIANQAVDSISGDIIDQETVINDIIDQTYQYAPGTGGAVIVIE